MVTTKIQKYKVNRSNYLMKCTKKDFNASNEWGNCRGVIRH